MIWDRDDFFDHASGKFKRHFIDTEHLTQERAALRDKFTYGTKVLGHHERPVGWTNLDERVISSLLKRWEGPVTITAGLSLLTGVPHDFDDQINNEIVRRLGRAVPIWTTAADNEYDYRFRQQVTLEFICHLIMNLCPDCFMWNEKLDCNFKFPIMDCSWDGPLDEYSRVDYHLIGSW